MQVKNFIINTTKAINTKTIAAASLCLLAMTALSPNTAYAACSNNMDGVAGVAGEIEFFTPDNVLRYCDDTNWVDMVYKGPIPPDSSSIVNFFSDFFAPPAPTTGYIANAVNFDGTNDYLLRGSDMTGAADSKLLTFSFWLRLADTAATPKIVYNNTASGILLFANGNSISFSLKNSAGTTITNARITNSAVANEWYHVLVSVDTANTASSSMYLNDVASGTFFSPNPFIDDNIAISKAQHSIGSAVNTTQKFNGDLADLWIDYGTFIDLSVEANRRKFISNDGYPVNLNTDGSLPTGSIPDIFLSGDTATWHTNKGTGGGFTENGALTDGPNVTPNGLVAHYKLDETSGTTATDFTSNGNDGTMTGGLDAATNSIGAPIGSGLVLDGSDEIDAGLVNLLTGETEGSACGWLKIGDTDVLKDHAIISEYDSDGWMLFVDDIASISSNVNTVTFLAGGTAAGGRVEAASDIVQAGEWEHYCGTFSGGNFIRLYRNGSLIASNTTSIIASFSAGTPSLVVGGVSLVNTSRNVNGALDDARVYNRVLSDAEITALYDLGKDRASLIGHFKLDETSGTTGIDSSILANDGTYINGVTPATDSKDGVYDGAIDFYAEGLSNKELKAPSNNTYTNTSELTYAAWIKPRDFGGHRGIIELVDNAHIKTYFSTDDLSFGVEAWDDGFHSWRASTTIPPNEWTHIAVTYSYNDAPNTAPKLYINGILFTGFITGGGIATSTYTLPATSAAVVGRVEWNGSGKNFNGLVDDARIYNRVLTASEIQELYNDANGALVGHFKLDETSGTSVTDSSQSANPANWVGTPAIDSSNGIIDNAFSFSTADATYVSISSTNELDFSDENEFTIGAWLKPEDSSSFRTILGRGISPNNASQTSYWLRRYNSQYQGQISDGSTTKSLFFGGSEFALNEWQHIMLRWDGSVLSGFVNGQLQNSTTLSNYKLHSPTSITRIASAQSINGDIDDARFYNKALTDAEIAALVKTGTGGLVAHYKLDEASGTTAADSSIYNNDAAMNGGLNANDNQVDGPMNTAMEFDGVNDNIDVTNPKLVLGTAPKFSVMAWIKPNQIKDTYVFKWGSGSGKSPSIQFNADKLRFGITGSRIDAAMTDMGIAENKWSHVTITYDGTTGRIYGNGVLIASDTLNVTAVDDGKIEIGGPPNFDGAIDDVKIYDRALDDVEILAAFNAGDPPPVPNDNLLAHWEFEETSGTTAVDSTGNGYDLTISSALTANSVPGKIDNAFDFFAAGNGANGQANIPASFTANKQFTVAMWLRLKDLDTRQQGFFGTTNWFRIMNYFGNRVIFNTQAWDTNAVVYGPLLDLNKWTHIAVSYDYDAPYTQDPIFYVDGVMISTNWQGAAPSGAYTDPADETLFVGRRVDSSSGGFSGDMDDVRFYNRILSPAEVQALAGCTGPGPYYYNASNNNMQWCNGVNSAKDMGPADPLPSEGTCYLGQTGALQYYAAENTFYYCDSNRWVAVGRACTNCGGDAGEKIAFLTSSSTRPRNLGGISGADAICASEATQAGLSGTYLAWLADSDPTSAPATRFSPAIKGSVPIVLPNGDRIADDWADLTSGNPIDNLLDKNAFGAYRSSNILYATTNVNANGTQNSATETCGDWTASDTSAVEVGRYDNTTLWTDHPSTFSCAQQMGLYCFEQ